MNTFYIYLVRIAGIFTVLQKVMGELYHEPCCRETHRQGGAYPGSLVRYGKNAAGLVRQNAVAYERPLPDGLWLSGSGINRDGYNDQCQGLLALPARSRS